MSTKIQNGKILEQNKLEDIKKEISKGEYKIEVDTIEKAKELLEGAEIEDNKIVVKTTRAEIPNIIEKLVKNHIKIYSVTENIASLEEAFLKKTGGNVIE